MRNHSKEAFQAYLDGALVKETRPSLEYILDHNTDVHWKVNYGKDLLETAIKVDDLEGVKSLLNHGANTNVSMEIGVHSYTYEGGTLLHTAVLYDRIGITKLLLERGVDVNSKIICNELELEAVSIFSKEGTNSCIYWKNGHYRYSELTVLELAIVKYGSSGNTELIELLLKNCAIIDDATKKINTLRLAVLENAHVHVIEKLVEYGVNSADINSKNIIGQTPLQFLVNSSSKPSDKGQLELYLDYGSHINVQDKDGNTPLHLAINRINDTAVEILLAYEADITFLNAQGETPLAILHRLSLNNLNYNILKIKINYGSFAYDFYNYRCTDFENIACFLVRTIVTNAESGKHVNKEDLNFVKTELQIFYDSFKNEMEKMKLKKLRVNMSYYDIVTKSVSVLETCINKELIESLESSNIEMEFPFYGDMLRLRIRKIKERQILVEFCSKRIETIFQLENELPILVKEEILSFLNSVDLITLWRIFKQQGEYLAKFLNRPERVKNYESSNLCKLCKCEKE